MQNEYLFIYGSLKKGFSNHNRLNKGELEFVGNGITQDKYGMFKEGFENYPFVTTNVNLNRIEGEVYLIKNKEIIEKLDEFEGHPNYFKRIKIKVYLHNENQIIKKAFDIVDAYIYVNNNPKKIIRNENSLTNWKE